MPTTKYAPYLKKGSDVSKFGDYRKKFKSWGFTTIPDQHDIEKLDWLMRERDSFSASVDEMKKDWDKFCTEHKHVVNIDWLKKQFKKLSLNWTKRYNVTMINFELNDNSRDQISYLDNIDFRCMKILYDTKWEASTTETLLPTVKLLETKVHHNLYTLLEQQDNPPVVTEVSLLAWGTKVQEIHCDYVETTFNPKTKEEVVKEPPSPDPKNWYGTVLYPFSGAEQLEDP